MEISLILSVKKTIFFLVFLLVKVLNFPTGEKYKENGHHHIDSSRDGKHYSPSEKYQRKN